MVLLYVTLDRSVSRVTGYGPKDHSCQRYFLLSPRTGRRREPTEDVQWVSGYTARSAKLIFTVLTLNTSISLSSSADLLCAFVYEHWDFRFSRSTLLLSIFQKESYFIFCHCSFSSINLFITSVL
jgi:hypothetical protein